ncbi:MAG: hypothetical protein M1825_001462 [Sarcosagium campestre]|nr:MAG: hypothetical protein M1825_001462 [Sarcosagium campestre]
MAEEDDWKPNNRPQSMIARSFSAALNDAFGIDYDVGKVGDLSITVEQKKKAVSSQSQELEALEARLRETEERLKQRQSISRGPSPLPAWTERSNTPQRRKAVAPSSVDSHANENHHSLTPNGGHSGAALRPLAEGEEMPGGFPPTPNERVPDRQPALNNKSSAEEQQWERIEQHEGVEHSGAARNTPSQSRAAPDTFF